jgi:hypothetical protein
MLHSQIKKILLCSLFLGCSDTGTFSGKNLHADKTLSSADAEASPTEPGDEQVFNDETFQQAKAAKPSPSPFVSPLPQKQQVIRAKRNFHLIFNRSNLVGVGPASTCDQSGALDSWIAAGTALSNLKKAISSFQTDGLVLNELDYNWGDDGLFGPASLICPQNQSKILEVSSDHYFCKDLVSESFARVNICGTTYDKTIFNATPEKRPLDGINDSPDEEHQLLIATFYQGSQITAADFIALLSKNFTPKIRVSFLFPKSDACYAKLSPRLGDAIYNSERGRTVYTRSTVFQAIADATGGKTYDLCDQNFEQAINELDSLAVSAE